LPILFQATRPDPLHLFKQKAGPYPHIVRY
jgi:hypothetical protein